MGIINNRIFYTYKDITIVPSAISDIEHRSECNPYNENDMLPLFTAPMNTVVSKENFNLFEENKINAILPRTESLEDRINFSLQGKWAAFSLNEFESIFCNNEKILGNGNPMKVLIDVANGHMKKIIDLVKKSKEIYDKNIVIMAGNIANPDTYESYAMVGVDYCRCSIGTGFCCISSTQLGVHYPIASLINDITRIKKYIEKSITEKNSIYKTIPKIIADGGIRNYSDIIKALALGADYVMCGSIFAKMLESAAEKEYFYESEYGTALCSGDVSNVRKENDTKYWVGEYRGETVKLTNIFSIFYGMASKEGQIALNGEKNKTSEGIKKKVEVKYTIGGWSKNFKDYIRSAMSYTNNKTLKDFKNNCNLIINSPNAVLAVNE